MMKNSPFLNLLTEENIKKINIDSSLIPIFKIVITKIDAYFKKNNLMDAKDWDAYFKKYLLSNGTEQLTIRLINESEESIGGEYRRDRHEMTVHPLNKENIDSICSSFCHEFIHFLVMHDLSFLDDRFSDSRILNEGMTEYLTMNIMNLKTFSLYLNEIKMAKFYSLINQNKNPFFYFLNDKFTPNYNIHAITNIIRSSERYYHDSSLNSVMQVQREIINHSLDNFPLNSFDDFVNLLTIINNRPYFDYQYINIIFENIIDRYIMLNYLNNIDKDILKEKLMRFCLVLNKAQIYGNNEIAEYLLGDLYIAFDKKGKYYNNILLNDGGIYTDIGRNVIVVTNNGKRYTININDMKCKNWQVIFEDYYKTLKKELPDISKRTK